MELDKKQLIESLQKQFLDDPEDHINGIRDDIMALEKGNNDSIMSLLRHFHSFKGEAQAIGFQKTSDFCHRMEEVMEKWREKKIENELLSQGIDLLNDCFYDLESHLEFLRVKDSTDELLLCQWEKSVNILKKWIEDIPIIENEPIGANSKTNQIIELSNEKNKENELEYGSVGDRSNLYRSGKRGLYHKKKDNPTHNQLQYLLFENFDQHYAISIEDIIEVIDIASVNILPNQGKRFKGVAEVKGQYIPIIDEAMIFSTKKKKILKNNFRSLLICKLDDEILGVEIDSAKQVVSIDSAKWRKIQKSVKKLDESVMSKITKFEDKPVLLLDIRRFLCN